MEIVDLCSWWHDNYCSNGMLMVWKILWCLVALSFYFSLVSDLINNLLLFLCPMLWSNIGFKICCSFSSLTFESIGEVFFTPCFRLECCIIFLFRPLYYRFSVLTFITLVRLGYLLYQQTLPAIPVTLNQQTLPSIPFILNQQTLPAIPVIDSRFLYLTNL